MMVLVAVRRVHLRSPSTSPVRKAPIQPPQLRNKSLRKHQKTELNKYLCLPLADSEEVEAPQKAPLEALKEVMPMQLLERVEQEQQQALVAAPTPQVPDGI